MRLQAASKYSARRRSAQSASRDWKSLRLALTKKFVRSPRFAGAPPALRRQAQPKWMTDLRFDFKNHSRSFVGGYLVEICAAIQNDAPRLAAVGMRSLLEHVMIQNVGDHGTFGKNLDEFRKAGFLSQTQADYLAKTLEGGQPIPGEGLQCQADMNKWTKWETLGAIMGLMLRRSGFPLASPNGPRSVDPPFSETWPPPVPDFVVEATLKLQDQTHRSQLARLPSALSSDWRSISTGPRRLSLPRRGPERTSRQNRRMSTCEREMRCWAWRSSSWPTGSPPADNA
jgi:hypothetical protein